MGKCPTGHQAVGWYGVEPVSLEKVTYTSVMAALMHTQLLWDFSAKHNAFKTSLPRDVVIFFF